MVSSTTKARPKNRIRRYNVPGELYVIQTRNCIDCHWNVFKLGRARKVPKRLAQYPKGSRVLFCLPVTRMVDAETMMLTLCRIKFKQRKDFGKEYFEGDLFLITRTLQEVAELFRPIPGQQGSMGGASCVITEVAAGAVAAAGADNSMAPSADTDSDTDPDIDPDSDTDSEWEDCMDYKEDEAVVDEAAVVLAREVEVASAEAQGEIFAVEKTAKLSSAETDPTVLFLQYIHTNLSDLVGPVHTATLLENITQMYRAAGCKSSPSLKSLFRDLRHYFKCTETTLYVFPDGLTGHATTFPSEAQVVGEGNPARKITNPLEDFFSSSDKERGCTIERVEGRFTTLTDFKAVFEREKAGKDIVKYVEDTAILQSHGFALSKKMEFVCKSCKGLSKGRPKCCAEYSDTNRGVKRLIYNMVMTPLTTGDS